MWTTRVYLRPVGRIALSPATDVPGHALAVAGRADLLFAAAEIAEREGKVVRRRLVTAAELASDPSGETAALLQRIQQPRPPIAGLALDRPRIMGIVNVTPDSFSDGGRYLDAEAAIAHGAAARGRRRRHPRHRRRVRPGPAPSPSDLEEELRRVMPVIEALAAGAAAPVSIDTRKAEVMRRAADAGRAHHQRRLGADARSRSLARSRPRRGLPVVLMHAQGDPRTMQDDPRYDDVVLDVYDCARRPHRGLRARPASRARG